MDLPVLLFCLHLFQVFCLFFLLAPAWTIIFHCMIMALIIFEALVRLLSYVNTYEEQVVSSFQWIRRMSLLLPISLGAKVTDLPSQGWKKSISHLFSPWSSSRARNVADPSRLLREEPARRIGSEFSLCPIVKDSLANIGLPSVFSHKMTLWTEIRNTTGKPLGEDRGWGARGM